LPRAVKEKGPQRANAEGRANDGNEFLDLAKPGLDPVGGWFNELSCVVDVLFDNQAIAMGPLLRLGIGISKPLAYLDGEGNQESKLVSIELLDELPPSLLGGVDDVKPHAGRLVGLASIDGGHHLNILGATHERSKVGSG